MFHVATFYFQMPVLLDVQGRSNRSLNFRQVSQTENKLELSASSTETKYNWGTVTDETVRTVQVWRIFAQTSGGCEWPCKELAPHSEHQNLMGFLGVTWWDLQWLDCSVVQHVERRLAWCWIQWVHKDIHTGSSLPRRTTPRSDPCALKWTRESSWLPRVSTTNISWTTGAPSHELKQRSRDKLRELWLHC